MAGSAALEGSITAQEARSVFIEAATEANMNVDDVGDSLIRALIAKVLPDSFE
jgi:hypothetical protein